MSHVQDIIGKSPAAENIRAFVSKAAKTDWPVFLTGETGVGKEVVARAIHRLSSKNGRPFVPVNCAAIPLTLAESEIFGYCPGAFTDARREKSGLVEEGADGTVFLDEVTECSQDLQAKLLRLLEYKEFRRVGEAAMRKTQARFILASNEDPTLAMKSGKLRQDFYHRINILSLKIPPLRERREDIPLFIEKFLGDMTMALHEKKRLSSKALKILTDYSFPGNVRELTNILRRACLQAEGMEIRPEDMILENDDRKDGDLPQRLFHQIVDQGKSFWEVVHKPFLQRELKRSEVIGLLDLGLRKTKGSYRKLLELFNAGCGDKHYKRFMKVIEVHGLRDRKTSPSGGIESPPGGRLRK